MKRFLGAVSALLGVGMSLVPQNAQASVVGCDPATSLQSSPTYGVIAAFGAQCDHSLDVEIIGRIYRGDTLVSRRDKTCLDTSQGEWCQDHVFASNPSGKQRFRITVTVRYDLHDGGGYETKVTASSIGWF